jgi:hypothetical protein
MVHAVSFFWYPILMVITCRYCVPTVLEISFSQDQQTTWNIIQGKTGCHEIATAKAF